MIIGMRARWNVSTTSKGFKSFDHTAEIQVEGEITPEDEQVLAALSDRNEMELNTRYASLRDPGK